MPRLGCFHAKWCFLPCQLVAPSGAGGGRGLSRCPCWGVLGGFGELSVVPCQGEKNHGFDVLYHNMKHGQISTKELADFVRERYRGGGDGQGGPRHGRAPSPAPPPCCPQGCHRGELRQGHGEAV